MRLFKNIVLVLATGYIFVTFSEHFFWARPRPGDTAGDWIGAWLAYSSVAYVFLVVMAHYRVATGWALFAAGAVVGWLTEGVLVQTVYEALPLSISWTGLAWHALISVCAGWYAMRQALLQAGMGPTLKLASAIGLLEGLWAVSWWQEPGAGVTPIPAFAAYQLSVTLLLMLAYALASWSALAPFVVNRWLVALAAAGFTAYFGLVAVPAAPVALFVLPVLLGAAFWGLGLRREGPGASPILDRLASGPTPIRNLAGLLALPLVSVAVYAACMAWQVQWQTNWIVYLVTTPLGFILFAVSLTRLWQGYERPPTNRRG